MGELGGIPLDVGDVLAKKYRLERLVGEGGTGIVVAARHLQLDQLVAIKFLKTALASDEIRIRFEREARAIEQIESEYVVVLYDVGALDDQSPYMVMEYLEGRDLAKVLKEDGPLGLEDAVDCMLQVCSALTEAHAHGIIHRDLKPANLFLTRNEDGGLHIKVVDFGISKMTMPSIMGKEQREMTEAFTVLGSPRYMAPEQLRSSKDVDLRADIWSLGAVLFQLVSGRAAFDAESNVHASLAVLTTEPPLLRSVAPQASKKLEGIVNRCLTKDREGRYQSAAELADALRPMASRRTRDAIAAAADARSSPSVTMGLGVRAEGARIDSAPSIREALTPPRLTPPLYAASSPRPSSPPREARAPSRPFRLTPVVFTVLGVLAVVLVFGVLSGLKLAARSLGVIKSAEETSPVPAAATTRTLDLPSQAITVTIDAGKLQ